jgi:hypothetical protein
VEQKVKYNESVGYLLSPHPIIMQHAMVNRSQQHDDAVSSLIAKLFLPRDVVGEARAVMRANLVHKFWTEHSDFTLKTGKYADLDMWIIARNPMVAAHEWHKTYSIT